MMKRIVLSLSLCTLMACAEYVEQEPDAPGAARGIGTSPSSAGVVLTPPDSPFAPCGVWVDVDAEAARVRAESGEFPDFMQFTIGHSSCSDLIFMARKHYGDHRYWVRPFHR